MTRTALPVKVEPRVVTRLVKSPLEDAGDGHAANLIRGGDEFPATVAYSGGMIDLGLSIPEPCDRLGCPSLILLLSH